MGTDWNAVAQELAPLPPPPPPPPAAGIVPGNDKSDTDAKPPVALPHTSANPAVARRPGDTGAVPAPTPTPTQPIDQILSLKKQIIETRNRGKLGFGKVVVCKSIGGFANYEPRGGAKFPPNGELVVYYEPANVFTRIAPGVAGGRYAVHYSQDLVLTLGSGLEVYKKTNVIEFKYASASPLIDLHARNAFDLGNLPPGSYNLDLILFDHLKNPGAKEPVNARTRISFEVVKPEPPKPPAPPKVEPEAKPAVKPAVKDEAKPAGDGKEGGTEIP